MTCFSFAQPHPLFPVYLGASERGLMALTIDRPPPGSGWVRQDDHPVIHEAVLQLEQYFAGKRRRFDLPLDLRGTEFQLRVWAALLSIPYGETRSYLQVAREAGSRQGARAVGQANHANPVALVVPCHRVVTASGALGGYGGGLARKRFLLDLENQESQGQTERFLVLADTAPLEL